MKTNVFLRGGMGNQFFQWLYAMSLAESNNAVILDTSFLRKVSGNQVSGTLELESVLSDLHLPLHHTPQLWRLERVFSRVARMLGKLQTEPQPSSNSRLARYQYGYYQQPNFLNTTLIQRAQNLVRPDLRAKFPCLTHYAAIHVRGGDYQTSRYNRMEIGLLGQRYYDEIFNLLAQKHNDLPLLIVSDDYARARQLLAAQDPQKLIYLDTLLYEKETPLDAFKALLNAKILCCANSSFSAMAGYLGTASETYAPKPWFRGDNLAHINPTLPNWHPVAAHF